LIKITKPYGYLIGIAAGLAIYFICQLFFFIGTAKVQGQICDIADRGRGRGIQVYYACFTNHDKEVIFRAGSNLDFSIGDTVNIIYKKHNPKKARIAGFLELWVLPGLYSLLIPLIIIVALITGLYYGNNRVVIITGKPFRISIIEQLPR